MFLILSAMEMLLHFAAMYPTFELIDVPCTVQNN